MQVRRELDFFKEDYLFHLQKGKVLAYPTETIWGLGVDAFNVKAVEKLFELKKRQREKSISLLVRDIRMAKECVHFSPLAEKLFLLLTPGPFTFVLPIKNTSLKHLSPLNDFLGIRLSSHPFVTHMVWAYENPITTTSANISGEKDFSLNTFRNLQDVLLVKIKEDKVSPFPSELQILKQASTVIKIEGSSFSILRAGDFDMNVLKKWMGRLFAQPCMNKPPSF